MNFVTNLRTGYSDSFVLSSKDFVTLSEILARSPLVEARYTNDEVFFVNKGFAKIDASSVIDSRIITAERFEEIKAEEVLS